MARKYPVTHEEVITRLRKAATHLAQAAKLLTSCRYAGGEAHVKTLDAYYSIMATKKWHEEEGRATQVQQ